MSLIVKGSKDILGREIKIIEGGFGEGKKALTDKMIAEIHDMKTIHVRELIVNNIKRFKEDIDFINLKGIVDTDTLCNLGYNKHTLSQAKNLFLLFERGYAKLIKIMDSDLAWEIAGEEHQAL